MTVTDIEDLEMIRDASEHDYQAWSDVASHAVESSDRDTASNTDMQDQEKSNVEGELPSVSRDFSEGRIISEVYSQNAWANSPPPACFVLTDSCISISDPPPCFERHPNRGRSSLLSCLRDYPQDPSSPDVRHHHYSACSYHRWEKGQYSLGGKLHSQFRMGSHNRETVQTFRLKQASSGEVHHEKLATAYIYVAPCDRLLSQAFGICWETTTSELFSVRIRVDDRLAVTCCQPGIACGRLVSLLRNIRLDGINSYWSQFVDQTWLEQRIYEIAEEKAQWASGSDTAERISFIYQESSYEPLETVGAISVVGEEAQVRKIMSSSSFPQHPRIPSASEIYVMHRSNLYPGPCRRQYSGTFIRNPHLSIRKNPSLIASSMDTCSQLGSTSRSASPAISERMLKRRRSFEEGGPQQSRANIGRSVQRTCVDRGPRGQRLPLHPHSLHPRRSSSQQTSTSYQQRSPGLMASAPPRVSLLFNA